MVKSALENNANHHKWIQMSLMGPKTNDVDATMKNLIAVESPKHTFFDSLIEEESPLEIIC